MKAQPILLLLLTTVLFLFGVSPLVGANLNDHPDLVTTLSSSQTSLTIAFNTSNSDLQDVQLNADSVERFTITGEGTTYEPGMPILPAISRFIVVPPQTGLELAINAGEAERIKSDTGPTICQADNLTETDREAVAEIRNIGVYPAVVAEMTEPIVIRGVRIVKVTTYPFQYDFNTGEYIHHPHIEASILFTDDQPVNPVEHPVRRNRSREFLKFIRALAINGDEVGRDDPDRDCEPEYVGHYLVVVQEFCLEYVVPFIEWRRKAGYKVGILCVNNMDALDDVIVKQDIRERYHDYLENGIDPFDYILFIGDRRNYYFGPGAQWILIAPLLSSDNLYACLEGNDEYPDVAYSRWASGSVPTLELAVGRTLAYEAHPYMEDTSWFDRAAVYSQHWGYQGPESNWEPSLHSTVRWGEEVLKRIGYQDIRRHETYEWDPRGEIVGPFIRDMLNVGTSLHIGRAENYYFCDWQFGARADFNEEVEDNVVFPIELNMCGHGERPRDLMFRTGSGEHLKGYVATTYCWYTPPTLPMNAVWLELIKGVLLNDLPLGWGIAYAVINWESYVTEYNEGIYKWIRDNCSSLGDPAIQPWLGVPRVLDFNAPELIASVDKVIEVHVFDPEHDNAAVEGAQVALYAPGDLPDPDDEAYADYDGYFMVTKKTAGDGWARFVFDRNVTFENHDQIYVTITGRDILPLYGEIEVGEPEEAVDIRDYTLEEIEGNGDDDINPGEQFQLELTAKNLGRNRLDDVTAVVTTQSPWIDIPENEIVFGEIDPGDAVDGRGAVNLQIAPDCPDGTSRSATRPVLSVEFASGENRWRSGIRLDPVAPHIVFSQVVGGNIIQPDEQLLDIMVRNTGRMDCPNLTAELISRGIGVMVIDDNALYDRVQVGRNERMDDDYFTVSGSQMVVPGSSSDMTLIVRTEEGFVDSMDFQLQIGEPRENAPQGPDDYGYICFDDTDVDWDLAPEYNWVEISLWDNDRDFDGTLIDFDGHPQYDMGESRVIDLNMITQFYGQECDQITVSTNGFIVLGSQERIRNFQNWPLDRGIGGGLGMVAPFWDDLRFGENSGVYYYNDQEEHRFIVEWFRLTHASDNRSNLTFQAILYDSNFWRTPSGDPMILFQYKNISNIQNVREGDQAWRNNTPYASVGISSPDGLTGISYTWKNEYPVTSSPLENRRAILFATSSMEIRSCFLSGTVIDAANRAPIFNAYVTTDYGYHTRTDNNGFWEFNEALAGVPFSITARAAGYNDSTRTGFEVQENDSISVDYGLLHGEFTSSVETFVVELDTERTMQVPITITNTGNGYLQWSAEKQLPALANVDPWQLRNSIPIGEIFNDTWVYGAVFIDDRYYVTGAHGDEPVVYVMDSDLNLVTTFPQPGEVNNGMRDLAWDGELLWGAANDSIYGFTTEGNVETVIGGRPPLPFRPITCIAYDPDLDLLWISGTTSDIATITREGTVIDSLRLPRNGLRIYGLAYYPEDTDGFSLYVFHNDFDLGYHRIHKYNTMTGDTLGVCLLRPSNDGSPRSTFITDQIDVYSWVLLTVSGFAPDAGSARIDSWQIDANSKWFEIDSTHGRIESGESDQQIVTFDTHGWQRGLELEGEFIFHHNAAGVITQIPVSLIIQPSAIPGDKQADIPLEFGITSIHPNPFNSRAVISFSIDKSQFTKLTVFDINGRKIAILYDGISQSGSHQVVWDAGNIPSGVYLLRIETTGRTQSMKTVLVR